MSEVSSYDCTFYGEISDIPFKLVLGPKAAEDYVPEDGEPTDPPAEPTSTATALKQLVSVVKALDVKVTENAKDIAALESENASR